MQNRPSHIGIDPRPPVETELLVQFLKACADLLRLQILKVLNSDSFSVQELCQIFSIKQSAISHHLKLLAEAGIVTTRREGNTIYYRRNVLALNQPLSLINHELCKLVDQCQLDKPQQQGIEAIEQARIASSKQFFLTNATKLREQQDLIASFHQYDDAVARFLQSIILPDNQHAVEIGPGEGFFLDRLAQKFSRVSAFDISPELLTEAQKHVTEQQLDNVTLFLGDTQTAQENVQDADCVILNMVLHHVASPSDMFHDISQLLKINGALIITDLCHHDQLWAKTSCGDVWLGFEPDDLSFWAKNAGLAEGESTFLAQRNGFRIQIRHFYKIEDHFHE